MVLLMQGYLVNPSRWIKMAEIAPHLTLGSALSVFWGIMLGGGGEVPHVALSTY